MDQLRLWHIEVAKQTLIKMNSLAYTDMSYHLIWSLRYLAMLKARIFSVPKMGDIILTRTLVLSGPTERSSRLMAKYDFKVQINLYFCDIRQYFLYHFLTLQINKLPFFFFFFQMQGKYGFIMKKWIIRRYLTLSGVNICLFSWSWRLLAWK